MNKINKFDLKKIENNNKRKKDAQVGRRNPQGLVKRTHPLNTGIKNQPYIFAKKMTAINIFKVS